MDHGASAIKDLGDEIGIKLLDQIGGFGQECDITDGIKVDAFSGISLGLLFRENALADEIGA